MARAVRFDGLFINTKTTRCAHSCRYCSISRKDFSNVALNRFERVVDRAIEWAARHREPTFRINPVINNSDDLELADIAPVTKLRARAGIHDELVLTGGLRMRPESEMREWLAAWQELGINHVHASYAGHGALHDRWNGRQGDFEWLMSVQRMAGRLGLDLGQSLFLTKGTLPLIAGLIERLDTIDARIRYRWIFPFGYVGLAARHEDDRIDEAVRDSLSNCLGEAAPNTAKWHSEREWIEIVRNDANADAPTDETLHLEVNDANIDRLEATPWDAIIADLEARTQAVYAAVPRVSELARARGDPSNRRIYTARGQVDRLWLSRHLAATRLRPDLSLTQLGIDH